MFWTWAKTFIYYIYYMYLQALAIPLGLIKWIAGLDLIPTPNTLTREIANIMNDYPSPQKGLSPSVFNLDAVNKIFVLFLQIQIKYILRSHRTINSDGAERCLFSPSKLVSKFGIFLWEVSVL